MDRLFGLRKRGTTEAHQCDRLCAALDPVKLTPDQWYGRTVQGRSEKVPQSHHFRSGEALEEILCRYVWRYNQQPAQSAMGCKTLLQAMKNRYELKLGLSKKPP